MEQKDFSAYRILIVDDSDYSRSQLRQLLSQSGFNVVGDAATPGDALKLIKEKKPHLVLMDVVMPEMSGIDLTEHIMTNQMGTAVIIISSLTQDQVVLDAIGSGAIDFIAKPVEPRQLIDSVTKYLATLGKE
jgi:two-component system, chemotaxis family, chemotaxis protein CheY